MASPHSQHPRDMNRLALPPLSLPLSTLPLPLVGLLPATAYSSSQSGISVKGVPSLSQCPNSGNRWDPRTIDILHCERGDFDIYLPSIESIHLGGHKIGSAYLGGRLGSGAHHRSISLCLSANWSNLLSSQVSKSAMIPLNLCKLSVPFLDMT